MQEATHPFTLHPKLELNFILGYRNLNIYTNRAGVSHEKDRTYPYHLMHWKQIYRLVSVWWWCAK